MAVSSTPNVRHPAVAAVILAAGSSTRLGHPKQLVALAGRPLLQHVVDAALAAGVGEVVLVLGHRADEVLGALTLAPPVRAVRNDVYDSGQASSLAAGLRSLGDGVARAVVLLGDQPHVAVASIEAVAGDARPICRIRYDDGPGHPVAFDRALWPQLRGIRGDRGARDLIAASPELVGEIAVPGPTPRDVDTEADVTALASDDGAGFGG